jgi:hypothetical protein
LVSSHAGLHGLASARREIVPYPFGCMRCTAKKLSI